jgi:hypothetical protein
VKVFAVFVLFLACLVPCYADTTQTWTVSASCSHTSSSFTCPDPDTISATFTTQLETGTFELSDEPIFITGTVPVITNISGTFDGLPMALISVPGSDWLLTGCDAITCIAEPEDVFFSAGANTYLLFYAGDAMLQTVPFNGNIDALTWSAVDPVPEPSLFSMLLVGLIACSYARNRNRSAESIGL